MKTIIIDGVEYNLTPKVAFREGDWVVSPTGVCWHIDRIENNRYEVTADTGQHADWPLGTKLYHLWTIQDAKAGDVLVSESTCGLGTWYCIFKSLDGDESMTVYCYLARDGRFETKKELCFDKDPYNTKPATKEQRDQLEKAMANAGYIFDFEKKELKKIEPKSSWSEEDETGWTNTMIMIKECAANHYTKGSIDLVVSWLKSLKDRIQPKQEWSEEDEQYLLVCKNALAKYQVSDKWDATIISRWLEDKLKSLRPQNNITDKELAQAKKEAFNHTLDKIEYHSGEPTFDDGWSAAIWYLKKRNAQPQNTWKPSDEQMDALRYVANFDYGGHKATLVSLYEQLKKLKE